MKHIFCIFFFLLGAASIPLAAQEIGEIQNQPKEINPPLPGEKVLDPFADIPDISSPAPILNPGQSPDTLPSRWQSQAKITSTLSSQGKIYRDSSQNDSQSNQDNRLKLRSLSLMLGFDLQANLTLMRKPRDASQLPRKRLELVANFYGEANNEQARNPGSTDLQAVTLAPELANFQFGFRQLYASFFASLGSGSTENNGELLVSAGKQAYAQGVSIYMNPLNYLDDSGSFFQVKNNWQLLLGLSWPVISFRIRYMPVFQFRSDSDLQANILGNPSTDYTPWEYALSFIESQNRRQLLSLEASLFLGQTNWRLIGYIMEKKRYDWTDGFYLAIGGSALLPFSLGKQHFQLYGEGLLGNGLNKLGRLESSGQPVLPGLGHPPQYLWENASLNEVKFRGLIGLQWSPAANLDLYWEYRYDGSAFDSSQLHRLLSSMADYNNFASKDLRQGLFWQGLTERTVFAEPFALTQHLVVLGATWRNIADYLDIQLSYFFAIPDASSALQVRASLFLFNRVLQVYCENRWFFPSFLDYWDVGAFGMTPYLGSIEIGLELSK